MNTEVHILSTFGNRLREARHIMQISQAQLARIVNVRQATICDYEMGRVMPDFKVVWELSQTLNVPVSYFFPDTRRSPLNEQQRANLALVEGLPDELRCYVLMLIEQLFKLQNEIEQVNKLKNHEQSKETLRFLRRNINQLHWKSTHGKFKNVPFDLLAQFAAIIAIGGMHGWLSDSVLPEESAS
jgi:transcriptional regulator with XRE-family HTH domain